MRQSLVYNITVACTAGTVPVCPKLLKHVLFIILRTWPEKPCVARPITVWTVTSYTSIRILKFIV